MIAMARRNGSKKSGAVASATSVMRDDENIDRSELVDGANEFSSLFRVRSP